MNRYRGRPKRDANHALIVAALEAHGWFVQDLVGVGGGCPDLVVFRVRPTERPRWAFVEVKDGAKKWKRHNPKVLERQQAWADRFARFGGKVEMVTCVEDVQRFVAETP